MKQRPVPWLLLVAAIPFWTSASLLNSALSRKPAPAAPPPLVKLEVRPPRRCLDLRFQTPRNFPDCDWNLRPRRRFSNPLGDFTIMPSPHRIGLAQGRYPTLLLNGS